MVYPVPQRGRVVTVRCLPKRLDEVKHGAWEVWAGLIPAGHNHELIATELVAYTKDPFTADTLEIALKANQSVKVTVRDSPAGWQIQECER